MGRMSGASCAFLLCASFVPHPYSVETPVQKRSVRRHCQRMLDYRRNRVPGGTYFFTANLLDRTSGVLVTNVDALRHSVRGVRARAPFHIDAWVVLPDHIHCICTLPPGDADYAGRWRSLKKSFSKAIPPTEYRSAVRLRRAERGIWQRRFWEHTIRDDRDYAAHLDPRDPRHGNSASGAERRISAASCASFAPND
jgi:putative transposase